MKFSPTFLRSTGLLSVQTALETQKAFVCGMPTNCLTTPTSIPTGSNALYREDHYTSYDHETVSFTLGLTVEEQYVTDEQYTNQQRKIQEILNVLTPRQKEIIYYRYIQELSFDEICIMMDMNYQSAQNLIQRSLKKIRDLYGPVELFLLLLSISVQ